MILSKIKSSPTRPPATQAALSSLLRKIFHPEPFFNTQSDTFNTMHCFSSIQLTCFSERTRIAVKKSSVFTLNGGPEDKPIPNRTCPLSSHPSKTKLLGVTDSIRAIGPFESPSRLFSHFPSLNTSHSSLRSSNSSLGARSSRSPDSKGQS